MLLGGKKAKDASWRRIGLVLSLKADNALPVPSSPVTSALLNVEMHAGTLVELDHFFNVEP